MTWSRKIIYPFLILALVVTMTPLAGFAGAGPDAAYGAAKLKAPASFSGKAVTDKKVKLTWSKVKGAKSYVVYRSGKKIATVKGTSYTDKKVKKNKVYSYKVKAKKGASSWTIKVKAKKSANVKTVKLNKKTLKLDAGKTAKLKATLKPTKKIVSKKVVWKSSNTKVATVKNGKVTAKAAGKATITARAHNGVKATCKVTVKADPLTAVCSNGKFVGTREASGIISFKGIPYAKAPTGNLRWKAPQAPDKSNKVIQAKEFGHPAVQANYPLPEPASGPEGVSWVFDPVKYTCSEDCLTLNVWKDPTDKTKKKPVMIWFHGGGFVVGSTTNGAYQLENFVRQESDVIMVSANYRLGMLGSMDLSQVPDGKTYKKADFKEAQNLAMLDYIQAIKWVKENIAAFGGDPDNITIFGNSAGAANVTMLSLCNDPDIQAGKLFQHVIAQSGGLALYEANDDMEKNPVCKGDRKAWTSDLMKLVGAKNLDDLMNVSEADLINAYTGYYDPAHPENGAKPMGQAGPEATGCLAYNAACPISGDDAGLLDKDLYEAAKTKGKNIDVLYGSNQNEWNYWTYEMAVFDPNADHPVPLLDVDNDVYTYGFIPDKMANELGAAATESEKTNNVQPFLAIDRVQAMKVAADKFATDEEWKAFIKAFYMMPAEADVPDSLVAMFKDSQANCMVNTEIYNDLTFRGPAIAAAERHAAANGKGRTYMYYWAKETGQPYQGASHASEISYVLSNPNHTCFSGKVNMTLAKQMTAMWASFARNGDPSIDGVKWDQYNDKTRSTMTMGLMGGKDDITLQMVDMVENSGTSAVDKVRNDLAKQYKYVAPLLKYRLK